MHFTGLALALVIERFVGYPKSIYGRIGHPVEWMGHLIGWVELAVNQGGAMKFEGRARGVLLLAAVLATVLLITVPLAWLLRTLPYGWIAEAIAATPLLAQSSLREHVEAVVKAFDRSLAEARAAVSMIVGRDPASLDESGVSRAAIESLAENTSDGVVAPAFWFALFGLPGIAAYKAVNTLDSMVGHKSDAYIHFGWASARFDDLVNLPCSRLTGALFAAAAIPHRWRNAWNVMVTDARKHQSPNAGWPEAAMAGALGIRLGGPRQYDGETSELAVLGHGRAALTRDDIRKGLALFGRAMTILCLLCLALGFLL